MSPIPFRFNLPEGQYVDFDGKLLQLTRRARDNERSLVFVCTDGVPVDMTDRAFLDFQLSSPPRLRLLTNAEASDRLEASGRARVTALSATREDYDDARRKLRYVQGWDIAGRPARTPAGMADVVAAVFEERRAQKLKPFEDKAPSARQVVRWIGAYFGDNPQQGNFDALLSQEANKGNFDEVLDPLARELLERVVDEHYFVDTRPTVQSVYPTVQAAFLEHNRPLPADAQLRVPSRNALYRYVRKQPMYELDYSRLGKLEADKKWRPKGSAPQTTRHNEVWEIDHTTVDCIVVDERTGLPIGRPTVTCVIDRHTRMIPGPPYISFDGPGTFCSIECLREAIVPKGERFRQENPEVTSEWPCFGIPATLIPDQAKHFKSQALRDGLLAINIDTQFAPLLKAWYKGKIERYFRTLSTDVFHRVPGTTFSSVFFRNKENVPEKVAVVTLPELRDYVNRYVADVYHRRFHRGIGTTPLLAWKESVARHGMQPMPNPERVRMALSHAVWRTPQHYGFEVEGLLYNNGKVAELRQRTAKPRPVRLSTDPLNLTSISFLDPDTGEFVAVPILPHMRELATGVTVDQWKLARALQKSNPEVLEGEAGARRALAIVDRAMHAKARKGGQENRRDAKAYFDRSTAARAIAEELEYDEGRSSAPVTAGMLGDNPCDADENSVPAGAPEASAPAGAGASPGRDQPSAREGTTQESRAPRQKKKSAGKKEESSADDAAAPLPGKAPALDEDDDLEALAARFGMTVRENDV